MNKSPKVFPPLPYLQDKYLACRSVDVEFTVGWVVRIDTLTRQEINDVLRSVLVAVSRSHLYAWECREKDRLILEIV